MDQDRPLARGGNFKLPDEAPALNFVRGALVIVVQADLSAGDHFGVGEELIELHEGSLIGFGRLNADRCRRSHRAAADRDWPLNSRQRSRA